MDMKRLQASLVVSIILVSVLPSTSNAAVTAGTKCVKSGVQQIHKGKKYTCIKLGRKLFWNNGVKHQIVSPTPAPISEDVFSPIAVTTLQGSSQSNQHMFSFTIPGANPALSNYELGFMLLKREGLDPSFDLDYSQPVVYKALTNDSFVITNEEIQQIFRSKGLDSSKLSIMFMI